MTTIAYRAGWMAADSQVRNSTGGFEGTVSKLLRLPCGGMAGMAGELALWPPISRWLAEGMPLKNRPHLRDCDDLDLLVVRGDGTVLWLEGNLEPYSVEGVKDNEGESCYSLGSGEKYAKAAMLAGASAELAVKIACTLDTGSSLPVDVMKLERKNG